ncbi:hypothetical protein RYX36_011891, partial [Vicia faba]
SIESLINGTLKGGVTRDNSGDYFIDFGVTELFEQLSTNDQGGLLNIAGPQFLMSRLRDLNY